MVPRLIRSLFCAPEVNPTTGKALTVPVLNPINKYGRVFFFSWFSFCMAFLSWYAFPPLLTITIRDDLKMTQDEVSNSNIVALAATAIIRIICGPLCDRVGPRWVFIGLLLVGSLPTALAGLVTNASGLIALRFFVGILGGTFVPCQVWCTGFFDKRIIGLVNAMSGGWGNSGEGITYFVMPAIFNSLVNRQHLTPHKAWRVAYVIPFIIIVCCSIAMALLCPDTPTGKWSERHLGDPLAQQDKGRSDSDPDTNADDSRPKQSSFNVDEKSSPKDQEATLEQIDRGQLANAETIKKPTFRQATLVMLAPSSMTLALCYICSFGVELAMGSFLGAYYYQRFPALGQTGSGDWAAMFGLLNVVARPTGGLISDMLYRRTHSLWAKKAFLVFTGICFSAFLLAIGLSAPGTQSTMFGLVAGCAIFAEAANGANFSIVPHVYPESNGVVSGLVGCFGNIGGVIFSIIFRYNGKDYSRSIWIMGAICMGLNVLLSWIPPAPRP